ncbi:response regulator transcription factor [bacterium]|nr:response regulator transcription factor [bacterium]MCB1219661.1 response regulator transcription factor [bacterium]UNM07466.1 MAG: response regulator transcription factor [Planctomycetales bacterium]
MAQSILIVDDEQQLRDMLGDALSQAGYQVRAARNVPEGRNELDSEAFDIVVLDINMNGSENGFDLLRWMRRTKRDKTPVILLTASSAEDEKLQAFELGADDYVVKPFSIPEFQARIKAVIRRYEKERPTEIEFGDVRIDCSARIVYKEDDEVKLRLKEYQILVTLAENPGVAISRHELFKSIWGDDSPSGEKTVDVTIHTLRDKIESDPSNPQFIQTVRGFGYRFQPSVESTVAS